MQLRIGCLAQKTSIEGSPLDIDRVRAALQDYDLDFFLSPEYSFSGILTAEERESRLAQLCTATKDSSAVIIPGTGLWTDGLYLYNTAYIISGGRVVSRHDKTSWTVEELELAAREGRQLNYQVRPRIIEAGGFSLGIEICIEHKLRTLYHEQFYRKQQTPDIHVVLSCGMSIYSSNLNTRNLAILCDGGIPRSAVMQKEGFGFRERPSHVEDGLVICE